MSLLSSCMIYCGVPTLVVLGQTSFVSSCLVDEGGYLFDVFLFFSTSPLDT